MFRFEHPEALLALIAIPLIWWTLQRISQKAKSIYDSIGDDTTVESMLHGYTIQSFVRKRYLLIFAFLFIVLSLSNPQFGLRKEEVETKKADVFIALDVSQSMLAEDVSPSRILRAKRLVDRLIQTFRSERIGLIAFAGNAYLHMPLTSDFNAAQSFAESMDPSLVPTQGTAIADVFTLVAKSFEAQGKAHPVLVLITDGEDHEGGIDEAVEQLMEKGVYVFIIGIGSTDGGYIPVKTASGEGFLRDDKGDLVKTALNPVFLNDLADKVKGRYYTYEGRNDLFSEISDRIKQLDKIALERRSFSEYRSYFQLFLILSLMCLLGYGYFTVKES